MQRFMLLVLTTILACSSLPALTVTADITTDTTWTNADSPILLNPTGTSGGIITVRNGATLTIDTSGGAVTVNWNEDCDFRVGDGTEQGTLKIKAVNALTFGVRTGGNVRISSTGQVSWLDSSATTTFTRYNSSNTWGALVFEAGQTRQSELRKCAFSYGGNDTRNGMIVVDDSATNTPTFNDIAFTNEPASGKAAIRFIGKGINTLRQGAFTLPFSVSGVTYVFRIGDVSTDTVTATAPVLHFPDITSPDTPTNLLTGTLAVGDAGNCSIIRFDDAYTFKTSASSSTRVRVVNGAFWGSSECRPIFETVSGSPSYTNWAGLIVDSTTSANVFGGQGPFAYLTVRNATTGVDVNTGPTFIPVSGQQTHWCFPGLVIKKCSTGFRVRTQLDSNGAGYCTVLKNADIGDPASTDDCNVNCVLVDYGRAILDGCQLKGAVTNAVQAGTTGANQRTSLTVRDCRVSDTATSTASTAINLNSCQGACDVTIERSIIEGWRTGVSFFQTSTGGYTPARTLTMRNTFISGEASGTNISSTGLSVQVQTASVCSILVEDCTISGVGKTGTGVGRGFWLQELRSTSSMTVRRTVIDSNTDFGVDVVSATNNTCQYTFEECSFTLNGDGGTDEGGIRDARAQSARVVASRCTFAGNNPRGATDGNGTQQLLAENCYWNASNGPSGSGPGSGDAVSANVDYSPFLARPYIGILTGGSPAGCAALGIKESAGTPYPDQLHILANTNYVVAWSFGSDFAGSAQSAYEIDIDDTSSFTSLVHNGSKTTSTSSEITLATSLTDGVTYYLRVRLWDAKDRVGPWYYSAFRTNSAPPQVSNTSRTPGDTSSAGDATPILVWQRVTDTDEDPLHFYVQVDTTSSFNSANLREANSTQTLTNGMFEISTDGGTTWLPFPSSGAPQGQATLVRLVCPTTWPNGLGTLGNGTWYWRARASDGFEYGSYASTWSFAVTRAYALAGRLVDANGFAVNGATIKVAHNGTVLGASGTTNASGDYAFTVTDDLKRGDTLVFFRDGGAAGTRATRIAHFTGEDMAGQDLKYRMIRVASDLDVPFTNAAFAADDGVDADIMWSEASGLVTIGGDTTNTYTVELACRWELTGHVTGFANDASLSVLAGGVLHSSVGNISMNSLSGNSGTIELFNDCLIEFEANSTTSGVFNIMDARVAFRTVNVGLTVNRGILCLRSSTVERKVVANGNAGFIRIDSSSSAEPAVAVFEGVEFSHVGVEFEVDGVCAAFNNCLFKDGLTTRHILWKSKDTRSVTTFRSVLFNHALTQGSQFNVEAVSDALVLNMVGCGGIRWGEGYDKNGGSEGDALDNKVLWSLLPPLSPKATPGATRVLLEWSASAQTELSGFGYNVYRATSPSGPWTKDNGTLIAPTANPSYVVGSLTNGTSYWFYVTVDDATEDADGVRAKSAYVSAAPAAASLAALSPASAASTSILAMTVVGTKTHWDTSATLTITGGSGLTVNDKIVLSPTLMLADATLNNAGVTTWTVTAARNDLWGDTAYDESVSANLSVVANSNESRPTISFTNPTADGNTSGAFTIGLSYSANGGDSIDTSTLELYASRDVTVQSVNRPAGTNLAQIGSFWDTLNGTTATCNVGQTSGTELFSNGEYSLSARVGNTTGKKSEWVTLRFYVEGASTSVAKTTTLLRQGDYNVSVVITGTFSTTVNAVTFGSNITALSFTKDSSSQVTAKVAVDQLAACGPRTFTVDMSSGTDPQGVVVIEYPTNILPTVTNAEPNRNPAVGGLNVFLSNGAFFKSETDLATRGRMMGMSWSRFYRSDVGCNGPLGHGWLGYYYQRAIWTIGGTDLVEWYTPDGRKESFSGIGTLTPPSGIYALATVDSTHGTVTIADRHGHKCVFNSQGRLAECVDRNGNKVTLEYNYAGQLVKITDDRAKTWEVVYYSHGRVQKVQDKVWSAGSPREIEYTYDSNGDLTEQKAPTTSRYDGSPLPRVTSGYRYVSHRLTECINPNEFAQGGTPASFMENRYELDANSNWRVVAQRLGGQDQWLYLRYASGTLIREIDRRGLRTEYTIDAGGRTTKVERYTKFWSVDTEDPVDHTAAPTEVSGKVRASDPDKFTTEFTYNDNHEVTSVLQPRGNKVAYEYPNPTAQTSGTATAVSGNVLTDSGASWTVNAFVGMTLRLGSGLGNYRYYPVISNTATAITVSDVYTLEKDGWTAGAAYSVFTNNPDPLAKGNLLKVTRSDEALGSLADIVSEYTYENRYQFVKTTKNPRGYTTTYVYDWEDTSSPTDAASGNLVRIEYPDVTIGQPSTQTIKVYMTYNQYGQVVSSVDGEGNATLYRYYSDGQGHDGFLFQRVSAYGVLDLTSEYDYDNVGNMTAQWPPRAFEPGATKDDFKTTYEVNELGQTWHVQGPKLRIGGSERVDSYMFFDANGRWTHSFREYTTDAGAEKMLPDSTQVLNPTWFVNQKASTAMAATWVESRTTYDILGRALNKTVDAIAGGTITQYTSFSYFDANDNLVTSVSALGNMSKTVFDERNLTYQSISGADSDVAATFTTNYDANGNVSTSVDARGFTSATYVYDGFDRATKVTDAAGHYRESDYDVNGNVTESRAFDSGNALLSKSRSYFDELDRGWKSERMAKDHLGIDIGDGWNTSTTLFDKNSRVVSSTDDNGVSHYTFYDAASRVTYTRDAIGNEVHNAYNLNGATTLRKYREVNGLTNVIEVSHEEYELDLADRVTKFRDRRYNMLTMDTETETKFDGWGRVTQTKDAADVTTDYQFDLLSRSTRTIRKPSATEADWIVTDTVYDQGSRVTRRTVYETGDDVSPTGPQHTDYVYDERNRLITLRRPDGDVWTYTYDANSNQLGWTDPLGTTVVNSYDARGLCTSRIINRGSGVVGATSEAYAYDGLGRLTSCSNCNGSNLISASTWFYNTLSMAERVDQTIANASGSIEGTWTSKSEYDATGFNTATIFSDGRRIEHAPDQLNRLLMSYDQTNDTLIARYVYAGPSRLIQSVFGNGIATTYDYEAAGCGCGGFSGFCEKVEAVHVDNPGVPVFTNERRYDPVGNVTVERQGHTGGFGGVYRYDNSYRLTDTYSGVDLADAGSDDIDEMAVPANTPGAFGKHTSYNLDTRGNRTGTGMLQESDTLMGGSTYTIYSTAYSAPSGDKMNLYASVDGQSFSYDAVEQMTSNPNVTHSTLAYDYKGQTITQSVGGTTLYNLFDCQGRKVCYATDNTSTPDYEEVLLTSPAMGGGCSCSSGNTDTKSEIIIKQDGSVVGTVQYVMGLAVSAPGSGSATHPANVASPSSGRGYGNVIVQELYQPNEFQQQRWILHDQLGSTAACFDENGDQSDEYTYDAWGQAFWSQVLLDGHPRNVANVFHDGGSGITSVTMNNTFARDPTNAVIRVARPNESSAANRLIYMGVLATSGGNTILVDDASQVFYGIVNGGGRFTVLGFHHKANAGVWYDIPVYDSGSDTTTFYGEAWNIGGGTAMEEQGATLIPDVQKPVHLTILSITVNPGANNDVIVVRGRADDLATTSDRFFIHVPPRFVNDPDDGSGQDAYAAPEKGGSLYLYAGYRYEMRRPGGTLGSPQANTGWYYCWNRMYDPLIGRWTSPDPAAVPWSNLQDYCEQSPALHSDSSGLVRDGPFTVPGKHGTFLFTNGNKEIAAPPPGLEIPFGLSKYEYTITFTPNTDCPRCKSMRFIQFMRSWGTRWGNRRTLRIDGGSNESVHYDSEDWMVDTDSDSPYFQNAGADGRISRDPQGNITSVFMTDVPSRHLWFTAGGWIPFGTWISLEFQAISCAVCPDEQKLLGCVEFTIEWTLGIGPGGETSTPSVKTVALHSRNDSQGGTNPKWFNNDKTVKTWNDNEAKDIPEMK